MTRMFKEDGLQDSGSSLPDLREALLSEEGLHHLPRLVTIGELALCFSHEIKDPLTTVIGNARILGDQLSADHPGRVLLEGIARSALRIQGMAESMLDFGRKRQRAMQVCGPMDLIQEAVAFIRPCFAQLQCPSISVKIDVESDCPPVLADRWQIIHILVNLLHNSAEAMTNSRERQVTLTAQREAHKMVRFTLADTGSGVAPQHVSQIFRPFFTTKGERGNGLGLFISRRTVEEHNGTISLQTSEAGTIFTICLPSH